VKLIEYNVVSISLFGFYSVGLFSGVRLCIQENSTGIAAVGGFLSDLTVLQTVHP